MKALLEYKFVFRFFRFIITHLLRQKFNYTCERIIPGICPYIVLANHTTNYDPLMIGLSFPGLLYYVASEHIFRWGLASRLINLLVAPIPRAKGTTEVRTVKDVYRKIKSGANVCIFAEGARTFTGETNPIPYSTGKLIKFSGASLITYRIAGGYFSSPRWAKTLRRGLMSGKVVREYAPEEIEKMSVDELNAVIQGDLYVNAYEDQKQKPVAYTGEKLAEHLENALYICPCCGGISTLKSKDDRFYCSCGLDLRYTAYGDLISQNERKLPFSTVLDWSKWQSRRIDELAVTYKEWPKDKMILSDKDQNLWLVDRATKSKLVVRGTLRLYNDRLDLDDEKGKTVAFRFEDISHMAIYSQMVLVFSTRERQTFEIKSDYPRSAIKYIALFKALKPSISPLRETGPHRTLLSGKKGLQPTMRP